MRFSGRFRHSFRTKTTIFEVGQKNLHVIPIKLDYTRGAGGPKGLVSNHLKSVWIRGNEEDGGNILKRMDDSRFSFDSDYEIKPSKSCDFLLISA